MQWSRFCQQKEGFVLIHYKQKKKKNIWNKQNKSTSTSRSNIFFFFQGADLFVENASKENNGGNYYTKEV